jgi:predicted hotdog family 3-hydroxylacyl-ACP dehydratase
MELIMVGAVQDILSFIPQRAPFVMVDEVIYSDETITRTKFLIKEDNIFVVDGFLKEPALIENIAQAVAATEGYLSQKENKPGRMGYIAAIKNLVITGFPQINDEIITEIKIEKQVFDLILITGKIFCNETMVAHCEMKIFITSPK